MTTSSIVAAFTILPFVSAFMPSDECDGELALTTSESVLSPGCACEFIHELDNIVIDTRKISDYMEDRDNATDSYPCGKTIHIPYEDPESVDWLGMGYTHGFLSRENDDLKTQEEFDDMFMDVLSEYYLDSPTAADIGKDMYIGVYCYAGGNAKTVVEILRGFGYKNVVNLGGTYADANDILSCGCPETDACGLCYRGDSSECESPYSKQNGHSENNYGEYLLFSGEILYDYDASCIYDYMSVNKVCDSKSWDGTSAQHVDPNYLDAVCQAR